jgi:FtsP/CotA-like multicopper oxidase with cupredoxin domain
MKHDKNKFTRRQVLKTGLYASAGMMLPWKFNFSKAYAATLSSELSDPAAQPKFVNLAPNALNPGFKYTPNVDGSFTVGVGPTTQWTGLVNPSGKPVFTKLFGYGQNGDYTWPGKTFEIQNADSGGAATTTVKWENNLFKQKHLLSVDTSLHWAYSLEGFKQFSINKDGIPIITHLHGGHSDFQFDGNPEFFFNPGAAITGPQWDNVPGGFTNTFQYDNDVPAGNLWYHDHALGITRLNVYAGMAGFYFVRDEYDTGQPGNPLGLPAFPYELAYAFQDRMFKKNGRLFYPAFPSDPFWDDFIRAEGLNTGLVPKPSALAEFFGDHMVVNGMIWPKADVEPRNYRLRLLNGTDSRFLVIRFQAVPAGATDLTNAGGPLPFYVIGSDQGLASEATETDTLVFEPGGRYDIVFDFKDLQGYRIIMENIGGDAPFGGDFGDDLAPEDLFENRQTDRIMAFDVLDVSNVEDSFDPNAINFGPDIGEPNAPNRRVALFEGNDEFGRLQPLLGTVADDLSSATAYTWFQPTTETPERDTTEIWEIYNFTGDAHPVHLHLVNFEILGRNEISFDSDEGDPGTPVEQHNGTFGVVPTITDIVEGALVDPAEEYVENAPKDMVTALPEQVTKIKATFDKDGRYVWHCHILSHEDHEMMRVLQVDA